MKKLLLVILLFVSLIQGCKSQDYIAYVPTVQTFTPINYGLLYNWYAATDARGITSSDDWVIPSVTQCQTLSTYLGGTFVAGGKMKEVGSTYWNTPNTDADNSSGFNGRGSGIRVESGVFSSLKNNMVIWSSTPLSTFYYTPQLNYNNSSFNPISNFGYKFYGVSIRLLYVGSDTPTSYVGNDGKVYRCVQIGTQIWLADNLAETEYRDDSVIVEVTDNTAWTLLTTGAFCFYNNDPVNK